MILFFISAVSCQESSSKLRQDDAGLTEALGNVPRIFEINQLEKLQPEPEVLVKEGNVIGMIMKDHSITCVDEKTVKNLVEPLIHKHVGKHMPDYHNPRITTTNFNVFKDGLLLLACSVVSEKDEKPIRVYIMPSLHENYIVIPRQAATYHCSTTSCPSTCMVAGTLGNPSRIWCECSGYGTSGCSLHAY